ncbi:acyl-CoA/acyl-ACP dehydrogenase [Paenibacillus sp. GYB006]|uniref:acyl-CoA dehydrogenase family protein n=1 Tax=Paenibacillus sp. GYB006 TaxID=2994394 RepID=UPI002F96AB5E
MSLFENSFIRTKNEQDTLIHIRTVANRHIDGARLADEKNELNSALISDLLTEGYHTYSVPNEYGGAQISLPLFLMCQEQIAMVDGPAALAIGWHHITMFNLAFHRHWNESVFQSLCKDVIKKQALINAADSESATGSPSRGGKPQTKVRRDSHGYILSGRKTFTSLSTALSYFIVSATDEDTGEISEYLIHKDMPGVFIEPTWNMAGMRGTASHDLVLQEVLLPEDALVFHRPSRPTGIPNVYLLNIPAVYLGIAQAARNEAVQFAASYQPNSLTHPILELPHIQQKLGQIELELTTARHLLYSVAERVERLGPSPAKDRLQQIAPDLGAAKVVAIQTALSVVDIAMRITGVHSLSMNSPLQRYYRDVRFGLHNPPMDDVVLGQLAKRFIAEHSAEYSSKSEA